MKKLKAMESKIKAIMELILEHVGWLTIMKHYGRFKFHANFHAMIKNVKNIDIGYSNLL